jgi:hypothetical protein
MFPSLMYLRLSGVQVKHGSLCCCVVFSFKVRYTTFSREGQQNLDVFHMVTSPKYFSNVNGTRDYAGGYMGTIIRLCKQCLDAYTICCAMLLYDSWMHVIRDVMIMIAWLVHIVH